MQRFRWSIAVLLLPAIAYLAAACERADTGLQPTPKPRADLVGDGSSTPVDYLGVNFGPIVSTTSYNYDWETGELTEGTATGSVSSTTNALEARIVDPSPPDPNGFGTFIGTAHPTRFDGETVVYTQSSCPSWPLFTCLADGTFTFGYMVMYNLRNKPLDDLTYLATMYNIQSGDCGGGSPRFGVVMSSGQEIHVYIGEPPAFTGCVTNSWQATGNFATDLAGLRWDTSQICPGTFYNTYSGAIACADAAGLVINSIWVGVDGAWSSGGAPDGNQTVLFKEIQVNNVTRFPH
ncbi:MAG TPA: hypothetical protein VG454_02355 [Gemmatimonadales bacterium]|nr:hypothetical protein [Gemmatimonadales bacterium]